MDSLQIFKGNIVFSASQQKIKTFGDSYLIVKDGKIDELCEILPEGYAGHPVCDFGKKLIIPGFTDMHVHASQWTQRGLGMDKKLIEWLETYTFKNEERFSDLRFAEETYRCFVNGLIKHGTLCSCIFATVHKAATELLFDLLDKKGLKAFVGKVNMDRNCSQALMEETSISLKETEELIARYNGNRRVRPILTPRLDPTCSENLLEGLGKLAVKHKVPIQSHLSENVDEVAWVANLYPGEKTYSHVYHSFGLFGHTPTLMAHCIHLSESEIAFMKDNNIIAVYCPDSNLNLSSGIMPARKLLNNGIAVVLGSDVGGGHHISMNKAMVSAIQLSKVMSMFQKELSPLTLEEVFYMATRRGGGFFGDTGSFEKGCWFDALVIDDSTLGNTDLSLPERLQRFIYIGDDRNISDRYVEGRRICF